MDCKRLGSTAVQLPEIGLGTWRYTGGIEPLRAGIEHGARFIDTAEIYGTEEVVGQAIRGRRNEVFLATKARALNFRRRSLIAAAEGSLRRLGTDHIDLYQLHWPNYIVPIAETMAAMEELVDSGKICYIGVSNFSVSELRAAQGALSKHKIVSNQVRYSLTERTIESGLLQYCRERQITIIAYSPLGTNFSELKKYDPEGVLARTAKSSGKSEVQVALNWLIAKDNVVAIPRASTTAHAIEDCEASGWRLSTEEYAGLDAKVRSRRAGPVKSGLRIWKRHLAQLAGRAL